MGIFLVSTCGSRRWQSRRAHAACTQGAVWAEHLGFQGGVLLSCQTTVNSCRENRKFPGILFKIELKMLSWEQNYWYIMVYYGNPIMTLMCHWCVMISIFLKFRLHHQLFKVIINCLKCRLMTGKIVFLAKMRVDATCWPKTGKCTWWIGEMWGRGLEN